MFRKLLLTIKDMLRTDSGVRYSGKHTKSLSLQNLILEDHPQREYRVICDHLLQKKSVEGNDTERR